MTIYYHAKTRGFYNDDVHGARTILKADPKWSPRKLLTPDPTWTRPTKFIKDPTWKRPRKFVPNPNWKRPTKLVPDPTWERPTKKVPDPAWHRPMLLVLDEKNATRTKDGKLDLREAQPTLYVPDENAEHPLIDVPDMELDCPLIEVPDEDAVPELIEVEDEEAEHPIIEVPDEEAEHPQLESDDPHDQPVYVEVPNPNCKLPPADELVEVSEEEHRELLEAQSQGLMIVPRRIDGRPIAVEREVDEKQRIAALEQAVEDFLDEQAQALGYRNADRLVSYAEDKTNAEWQKEAREFRARRSRIWEKAHSLFEEQSLTVDKLVMQLREIK